MVRDKFEYKLESMKDPVKKSDELAMLNRLGQDGWEMVQMWHGQDVMYTRHFFFYFKRRIVTDAD